MLSCWPDLFFCLLLFYLFLPSIGWLCGVGVFGLIVFSLSSGLAHRTPINNNNNNKNVKPCRVSNLHRNCLSSSTRMRSVKSCRVSNLHCEGSGQGHLRSRAGLRISRARSG